MRLVKGIILTCFLLTLASPGFASEPQLPKTPQKKLVYLVSDIRIPFWDIMWRGIKTRAENLGYEIISYSAENNAKNELQFTIKAIKENVAGIIVSPTNSSACVTILKFAKDAGIPVVISDIGSDSGDYVSFISSDNKGGAYEIGKILTQKMRQLGWQDGTVGIVAIPQKRANGQARTAGFMQALDEAGIKAAGIRQQVTFSYQETFDHTKDLIKNNPDLRALFLQGSDKYKGALDAIADADKTNEIILITFDAEPEFVDLIPKGILVGAGMQQPFLMGEKSVDALHNHLQGIPTKKNQQLPVLTISTDNISENLSAINRNVLGLEIP